MIDPTKQLRVVLCLFGLILILAVAAAIASGAGSASVMNFASAPISIMVKPNVVNLQVDKQGKIYAAAYLGNINDMTVNPELTANTKWDWRIMDDGGGQVTIDRSETQSQPDATILARFDKAGKYRVVLRCDVLNSGDKERMATREVVVNVTPSAS